MTDISYPPARVCQAKNLGGPRPTSIEHYHSADFSGLRLRILEALADLGESCIADLAGHLGLEKSTVSARLNELKQAGKVVLVGKRPSRSTGVKSEFWRVDNGQLF